jgi:hypothetical protein
MLKIKRTSQLIARDVPYIMHPKQSIKTLRQRYGVSDHRDFASSHLHEQFRTHSIDFPFVSANDLEEGRVVVLESMAQHYAVDSKGTVRNFLPSVLEFKVRHLLGQPRKENVRQEQDYFAEVKALLEDQYPMPLDAAKVVEKPKTVNPAQVSKTVSDRPWDQAIWEDTPWAEKSLVSVGWLFHKASEGLSSVSQWSDDTVKTIDQIGEDPETSELMRATAAALKTPARLGTGIVSGVAGTANLVISPEKRQQLKDGVVHLYNNPEIIKQLAKGFAEKPTYQQVADVFVIAGEAAIPIGMAHRINKASKTLDISKLWSSSALDHAVIGEFDDLFRLKGGMHGQQGFDEFLDGRSSVGVDYSIEEVVSFGVRNDGTSILMQPLPNGTRRIQLPRDAWASKKAFESASIKMPSGDRIKGIKTLWPESFTADDVIAASKSVLQKNAGNTTDRFLYGSYKGVQVKLVRDLDTGMVKTVHPTWDQ